MNEQLSQQNNWSINWKIDTIENVGHDYRKMSKYAIEWLKE